MKTIRVFWLAFGVIAAFSFLQSSLAAPRHPVPPWPQASLTTFSWDSPFWHAPMRSVAVGEEAAFFAESWSGYALVRDSLTTVSPVVIPVGGGERPNLALSHGAIRFWLSPTWTGATEKGGQGPGHHARLLELVNWSGKAPETRWSLYLSPDGSTLYFSGQGPFGVTDFLKSPVDFQPGEWWAITVCYSPTNSALWLNDQLVAKGEGVAAPPAWEQESLGLVVGSDALAQAVAGAQFEELTTFDYWPDAAQQAFYYRAASRRALLGPIGTAEEEAAKESFLAALRDSGGPPMPGEGEGAGEDGGGMEPISYDYPSNALWLEITVVTNGLAQLIVHGTVEDTAYEVLSRETLTNTAWASEGIVIGAAGQDWTPTAVAVLARTNTLFLWARSWADTDGDGLPDWWEMEHGLDPHNPDTGDTGACDGYKDGDNDGWTNLQEYQNGTSPNSFDTPPAPRALTVTLIAGGAHANLHWPPAAGPVTGYTIERSFTNVTAQVSGSTTYFADTGYTLPTGLYFTVPRYRLQAHYAGGNSQWGPWTSSAQSLAPAAAILSGGSSQVLVVAAMPKAPEASALRAGQWYTSYPEYSITNVNLPVTAFTNGVTAMPEPFAALTSTGAWYLQWVYTNGVAGAAIPVGLNPTIPFWDGREQLKQNLIFLLRAATVNDSFGYTYDDGFFAPYFIGSPTAYAYASFYEVENYFGTPDAYLAEFWPYEENHRYRNFAFSTTNLIGNGHLATGVYWDSSYGPTLDYAPAYQFNPPGSVGAIASLLGESETRWLYWTEFPPLSAGVSSGWWNGVGLSYQEPDFLMSIGARNLFGLPYQSVKLAWGDSGADTATLSAGGSTTAYDGLLYPETAPPVFQTVDYYFGRPWIDWLPGHDGFSPTNPSPLLVTSVGDAWFQVAGYAKLALTNGYTNKFGYLGQYFDTALKMTNGVATTNQTGILSPYGEFFPTEPGPAALVTMPDLDTGERGTGVVHVIKLQLDVNHDGVMDLTFGGPDNTSAARPFVFWVNNDHDTWNGKDLDVPQKPNYANNVIDGVRDLEDFARLWLVGLPPLPGASGYEVRLSWRNTTGTPAIKIYQHCEADGGLGYLTDTQAAALQADYVVGSGSSNGCGIALGTVGATPFTFAQWEMPLSPNHYLLFEGAGMGKGELVLTIARDSETLAETSAWFDLRNVDVLFEHAHIKDVITAFPAMRTNSTSTSTFKIDNQPNTTMGDAKQHIVLVHGWNNSQWQSESYAQTMFKRLYWQGYQGRFAALRWPTLTGLLTYNRSEYIAFRSAVGASAYFNSLRTRFPDYSINAAAHSMGNIVMMEALKLQAALGSNALNNYVLMEAAVPAHCYDTNAPLNLGLYIAELENPTPNTYLGYPGAVTNALRGKMFNFFNTNDLALVAWVANQNLNKPTGSLGYYIVPDVQPYLLPSTLITDPREIMAFCARPRSYAIGAQPGVQGMILGDEVDLNVQFGFGTGAPDHSGQYTRSIQQVGDFYFILRHKFDEQ